MVRSQAERSRGHDDSHRQESQQKARCGLSVGRGNGVRNGRGRLNAWRDPWGCAVAQLGEDNTAAGADRCVRRLLSALRARHPQHSDVLVSDRGRLLESRAPMVRATPFPSRAAEATAACRLDLAGGILSSLPAAVLPAGALSVAVAVDRRAFARVEAGTSGVEIESKDTLLKVAVLNVLSVSNDGVVGLVRRVLVGLEVETGLRVVTQARVPFEAGLASARSAGDRRGRGGHARDGPRVVRRGARGIRSLRG